MRSRFASVFLVILAFSGLCHAAISYSVNEAVGAGSVTGIIETDGTIGTLATANILDWNLVINDGSASFDLLGPLSGNNSQQLIVGTDLTATAAALNYNFSGSGLLLFQNPGTGSTINFVCFTSITCGGGLNQINLCLANCFVPVNIPTANVKVSPQSGLIQIATVSTVATPEPSSVGLLSLGLAAIACRKRASGWLERFCRR